MALHKLKRDPIHLETLGLYEALSPILEIGSDAHDPVRREAFTDRIAASLVASLANEGRLHGRRVEALFGALLIALDGALFLTHEDRGDFYVDDTDGPVKPPDYRVVDREGRQLLVEVKSLPPSNIKALRLRGEEVEGLRRYGDLTGTRVAIAAYWSGANLWTLVDLARLAKAGNGYELPLTEAAKFNELGQFGDMTIGTKPPLTLRLNVSVVDSPRAEAGEFKVRIDSVSLVGGNGPIQDEAERQIALFLLLHGEWDGEPTTVINDRGDPEAIEVSANPIEEAVELAERQGFAHIGTLSSMYSRLFNHATLDEDGHVRELQSEPDPGQMSALIPRSFWDSNDHELPLWGFHLQVDPLPGS